MTAGSWGYPAPEPDISLEELLAGGVQAQQDDLPTMMFVKIGEDVVDVRRIVAITREGRHAALHLEHGVVLDVPLSVDEVLSEVGRIFGDPESKDD